MTLGHLQHYTTLTDATHDCRYCVMSQFDRNWRRHSEEHFMRTLSAKDAKYGFGRLIDLARAEPVAVT